MRRENVALGVGLAAWYVIAMMKAAAVLFALAVMATGCGETGTGKGGAGGMAGSGGTAGTGGDPQDRLPCTEQGIRDAIAEGGGPHFFDCVGPTTVETTAEIVIDNDVILDGEGELTVDGQGDHRVFSVAAGVETELRGVTVTGGFAEGDFPDNSGGGIFNLGTLTLTDSTVSDNTAQVGGGINNSGTLTLTNSTVSGNTAQVYGGGISNNGTLTLTNGTVSGNNAGRDGGGIYISNTGTLTLTNGTVSGNTVGRDGGGIYNSGTLTLTNGTVSGNTAIDEGYGIYNEGTVTLTNSTVSDNRATFAGGIFNAGGSMLTLTSSTVDGVCSGTPPLVSNGYNIESPGDTCGFDQDTDQVDVTEGQLNLGPLQDNGGATMTHALGAGSVAIDVIPADMCEVDEDQRGQPRPETGGSMCDVGAFEVQP